MKLIDLKKACSKLINKNAGRYSVTPLTNDMMLENNKRYLELYKSVVTDLQIKGS